MRGTMRAGLTAALAGVCAGLVPSVGAAAPCTPVLSPSDEAALTGLINAERRAKKVPKVVKKTTLRKQGRKKSMAMARGAAFAHSGPLRWAHGRAGAQNIAMAPSALEAFQAMLKSPSHRANMLSRRYGLTGIGAARDCAGQIFFTVNLMARARG